MNTSKNTLKSLITSGSYSDVDVLLQTIPKELGWGFYGITMRKDKTMMRLLLDNGVEPTDEDLDNCIREHDLDTAKDFFVDYGCSPTEQAFEALFENRNIGTSDDSYMQILEWLYYDQECNIDKEVVYNVANMGVSPMIVKWFEEREE